MRVKSRILGLPKRIAHDDAYPGSTYCRELTNQIGKPIAWISRQSGIGLRRLHYLIAGSLETNGTTKSVTMTYPEQFALESLAEAVSALRR